jgi:hypothetical protein
MTVSIAAPGEWTELSAEPARGLLTSGTPLLRALRPLVLGGSLGLHVPLRRAELARLAEMVDGLEEGHGINGFGSRSLQGVSDAARSS